MKKTTIKTCLTSMVALVFTIGLSSFSQVLAQSAESFTSVERNDLIAASAMTTTDNYSLKFNGSSHVDIENYAGYAGAIDFSGSFTIEFWMKVDDVSGRRAVFSTRSQDVAGAFQIEVGTGNDGGTGRISVTGKDKWIFDSRDHVITTGNWIHVAYVRTGGEDARNQQMYINGNLISPHLMSSYHIQNNNNPYKLGTNYASEYFKGNIFNLTIWNSARSKAQILSGIDSAPDLTSSDLVAYYPMNEGAGAEIYDKSSNESSGKLFNTQWSTDGPSGFVQGVGGIDFTTVNATTPTKKITTNIKIKGLSLSPVDLTLAYNAAENEYSMYGSVEFPLMKDDNVKATLGSAENPGLILKNGVVTQVNLSITENFSLKGLEINANNLGMEWREENEISVYHIYGDASFSIDNVELDTDFGTDDKPGIVLEGNHLLKLDVLINSDLKLGNIELIAEDLRLDYEASSGDIFVTGTAEIKEVFEVKVDLGAGDEKGLIIDLSGSTPRFKVEAFSIEVDHLNLGTIDLKKLKLAFNEEGITESDVSVIIAGSDEIGGSMKFDGNPVELKSIDLYYRADNLDEAIEVFEGVQLAYISGGLKNLDDPHNLEVDAEIQVFAGGGLSFDGYSVTVVESGGKIVADKNGFTIDETLNFGAYRTSSESNSWGNYLGHYDSKFIVNFPYKKVSAAFNNQLPAGFAFIEMDESFTISPENIAVWTYVKFFVPDKVPVVGGKTLGSVDGAFHYYFGSSTGGYIAAWTEVGYWKIKQTVGARFNFHDESIKIIGSDGVNAIIQDYRDATKLRSGQSRPYTNSVHTFEIDGPAPTYTMIDARWYQEVDTVLVTVIGPEGFYEANRLTIESLNDNETMPDFGYEENMDFVINDTSAYFMISTPAMDNEKSGVRPSMVEGRYNVILSFPGTAPDSSSVTAYQYWQKPTIEMVVNKNEANRYELDINFWSALPDSTELMIFVNDSLTTANGRVIANVFAEDLEGDNYGSYSMEYSPNFIPLNDSLYFYAIINDGVNIPIKSDISLPHRHTHDINGKISFPAGADSLQAGLRVYLDIDEDGSWDIESTGGLEPFAVSNMEGRYNLPDVTKGTYRLSVVLPKGYRIQGTENRFGSVEVVFNGEPTTVNLEIETYTEN